MLNGTHLLAAALLLGTGVTLDPRVPAPAPAEVVAMMTGAAPDRDEAIVLQVRNGNWLDLGVYVLRGGGRHRLGSVTSHATGTFELPREILAGGLDVRFLADPVGSTENLVSERVDLGPGDVVEWTVRENLEFSSLSVW